MITFDSLGLRGRLGNALYQLASTIALGERLNEDVRLNEDWIHRPYFSVPDHYFGDTTRGTPAGEIVGRGLEPGPTTEWRKNFLQDYELFGDQLPMLRHCLAPSPLARTILEHESGRFDELPRPILSVHVRRGDNAVDPGVPNKHLYWPMPPISYYRAAIQRLRSSAASIAVFSDDPVWCEARLGDEVDYFHHGVSRPKEHERDYLTAPVLDWIDLQLMARCQPSGTMVSTRNGDKPIEDVSVGDQVLAYCQRPGARRLIGRVPLPQRSCGEEDCDRPVDARGLCMMHYQRRWPHGVGNRITRDPLVTGHPSGRRVLEVSSRHFSGDLVSVKTGAHTTRYTPEHPCIAKIGDAFFGKHLVYIMRRGNQFRVGTTAPSTSMRGRRSGRVAGNAADPRLRMSQEGGRATWVIAAFDSRAEALLEEKYVSARYGVPEIRFRSSTNDHVVPEEFWCRYGDNLDQGTQCLAEYGRDIAFPMFMPDGRTRDDNSELIIAATNLMNGMKVLDAEVYLASGGVGECGEAWVPIFVERDPYVGMVHSLTVDKNHTYVADGIVTHNCDLHVLSNSTFGWWGAMLAGDEDAIYPWPIVGPKLPEVRMEMALPPTWHRLDYKEI